MPYNRYATDAQTRARMTAVRTKNTDPELVVRAAMRLLGLRYRLHRADLPGRPDIVVPSLDLAVFVHGCFWHRHTCRKGQAAPRRNRRLWQKKFEANTARDRRSASTLRRSGWRVMTFWECRVRDPKAIERRIAAVINSERRV